MYCRCLQLCSAPSPNRANTLRLVPEGREFPRAALIGTPSTPPDYSSRGSREIGDLSIFKPAGDHRDQSILGVISLRYQTCDSAVAWYGRLPPRSGRCEGLGAVAR